MKEKIYNTIYGAIIGDALGVPVEFKTRDELKENPVTDMREYGTYNLPKGSWSDDTSMTLCLADSIGSLKKLDYEDIMKCFWDWAYYHKYTPDNKTFDIGLTCAASIERFHYEKIPPLECGGKDENSNGNGSLMRISPLPFYLYKTFGADAMEKEEAFEVVHNVSRLTHAHPISLIGCDIYCAIMIEILKGTKKSDLQGYALPKVEKFVRNHPEFENARSRYERIFHLDFKDLSEDKIESSGYVVDSLEAALWCFLTTENYKDCVLKAVNLGWDTDTIACIVGSIAGLYYNEVPEEWLNVIRNRRLIDGVIERFGGVF